MPREHVGDVVDVQDDAARADHEPEPEARDRRATGGARTPVHGSEHAEQPEDPDAGRRVPAREREGSRSSMGLPASGRGRS